MNTRGNILFLYKYNAFEAETEQFWYHLLSMDSIL